jgi:hypothetical protein
MTGTAGNANPCSGTSVAPDARTANANADGGAQAGRLDGPRPASRNHDALPGASRFLAGRSRSSYGGVHESARLPAWLKPVGSRSLAPLRQPIPPDPPKSANRLSPSRTRGSFPISETTAQTSARRRKRRYSSTSERMLRLSHLRGKLLGRAECATHAEFRHCKPCASRPSEGICSRNLKFSNWLGEFASDLTSAGSLKILPKRQALLPPQ